MEEEIASRKKDDEEESEGEDIDTEAEDGGAVFS